MADLSTLWIPTPNRGLQTNGGPDALTEEYAADLTNLLTHQPNELLMRGAFSNPTTAGSGRRMVAVWRHTNRTMVGYASASTGGGILPNMSFWFRQQASSNFLSRCSGGTGVDWYDHAGVKTNSGVIAEDKVPEGRGCQVGDYTYGYAHSPLTPGTDVENANGNYHWRRPFLRWDGTAAIGGITVYANAPQSGLDVCAHLNRVFVLGGRDVPSGAPANIDPVALYYSDEAGPTADTTAAWKDDVSGLVNKIIVGERTDPGVGLAVVRGNLVIFKRNSIWVLYGYSSSTFQLKRVTDTRGCIDRNSILQGDEGVFFMSQEGYEFFDGATFNNISFPIQDEIANLANVMCGTDSGNADSTASPFITACDAGNGYILISLNVLTLTGDEHTWTDTDDTKRAYLYHIPTGSWTRFTSDAFAGTQITPNRVFNWGSNDLMGMAGMDQFFRACGAISTPELTESGAWLNSAFGQDHDGTNPFSIPASWVTRRITLGAPWYKSQLHRLLFHYDWWHDDAGTVTGTAWTYQVEDDSGSVLTGPTALDGRVLANARIHGIHATKDAFHEVNGIRLTIAKTTNVARLNRTPKIYPIALEYQLTRQRRSV